MYNMISVPKRLIIYLEVKICTKERNKLKQHEMKHNVLCATSLDSNLYVDTEFHKAYKEEELLPAGGVKEGFLGR